MSPDQKSLSIYVSVSIDLGDIYHKTIYTLSHHT